MNSMAVYLQAFQLLTRVRTDAGVYFCVMYVVTGGLAAVLDETHFSSVMNAMLRYIRRSSED